MNDGDRVFRVELGAEPDPSFDWAELNSSRSSLGGVPVSTGTSPLPRVDASSTDMTGGRPRCASAFCEKAPIGEKDRATLVELPCPGEAGTPKSPSLPRVWKGELAVSFIFLRFWGLGEYCPSKSFAFRCILITKDEKFSDERESKRSKSNEETLQCTIRRSKLCPQNACFSNRVRLLFMYSAFRCLFAIEFAMSRKLCIDLLYTGEQSTTMMDVVEREWLGLEAAARSCGTITLRRSALSPLSSCEAMRP
mmetsp:Transcript_79611/g.140501  ORF Transcript_79611/g.140501 Transcript_79611/m.140501 type:complete len:251 (-) Transcript_79611:789-1541(-)